VTLLTESVCVHAWVCVCVCVHVCRCGSMILCVLHVSVLTSIIIICIIMTVSLFSQPQSIALGSSTSLLERLLLEPYFSHCSLLVAAVHILLGQSLSLHSLRMAEKYLLRFYEMYSPLYGKSNNAQYCGVIASLLVRTVLWYRRSSMHL
jgi:hypothetical protein